MLNVDHFIEKMRGWRFCLGLNILLAIGIFLCAILGRSLGIQGPALAISVVWPATGLSLAALLLFGYRAGAGVFAGNLVYNLLFFTNFASVDVLSPVQLVIGALFVTLGSFAQAMVSAYIIRAYSTPQMFRTVQDVFIFLIPAGMAACLIGSTVGVTTLTIVGELNRDLILPAWLTFWLGDTVGIYVITPLLVVWTLQHLEVRLSDHIPSAVCMLSLFAVIVYAAYFFDIPLPHLFVPIGVWAAYLFRMHGASLAIFLMTSASIVFAASHGYEGTSLISLITFIGVTVAASMIIAAIVNERAQAWALLDSRNLYLEKEVDVKVEILEHVRSEISRQKKSASHEEAMQIPLNASINQIERVANESLEALREIQELLEKEKGLTRQEKALFAEKLNRIKEGLSKTLVSQKLIAKQFE